MLQRRSKPVNGSVLAVVFDVVVVGTLLLVDGATAFAGVLFSFRGEVPDFGVVVVGVVVVVVEGVVVVVVVVGVVPVVPYPLRCSVSASAGVASAAASRSAAGKTKSLRDARDERLLIGDADASCGLVEAMTLVILMPTSVKWCGCDECYDPIGRRSPIPEVWAILAAQHRVWFAAFGP